jgi:lipoate-protein ligase A
MADVTRWGEGMTQGDGTREHETLASSPDPLTNLPSPLSTSRSTITSDNKHTIDHSRSMISFVYRPSIFRASRKSSRGLCARGHATWHERLSEPSNQLQIYRSRSSDPFINLSIEHHLFQKSPPGSKILFQYTNRPSIVIGRNQNPWLEVNLALLNPSAHGSTQTSTADLGKIDLVRRRSGGGTVFHDEGNVNWSVVCDFTEFTRDKHAEMVVRALRCVGIERARVNERHDIVLDQGSRDAASRTADPEDTHVTPFTSKELRPLKVSGSAYKMARNRALHHGTALLSSPNLNVIPHYLHSPAKPYISAKGVESVSSPVSNIGIENEVFMKAVQRHFMKQYKVPHDVQEVTVDDDALDIPEVRKGYEEMKSLEWTYLQTPGFTFSTQPLTEDQESPSVSCCLILITATLINEQHGPCLTFEARHGAILNCQWTADGSSEVDIEVSKGLGQALNGIRIHEHRDWDALLDGQLPADQAKEISDFLAKMFPYPE